MCILGTSMVYDTDGFISRDDDALPERAVEKRSRVRGREISTHGMARYGPLKF